MGGAEPMTLAAGLVVNSAGLAAPAVAGRIGGLDARHIPRAWFAKGNYFAVAGRQPFRRLVYPMPEASVLGVHVTLDLAGQCKFGPDLEWLEAPEYDVDPARAERFYDAVRRYYPALADGALQPAYSGIRPKIHGPGEPQPDFLLQGPETHGVPGLVNLVRHRVAGPDRLGPPSPTRWPAWPERRDAGRRFPGVARHRFRGAGGGLLRVHAGRGQGPARRRAIRRCRWSGRASPCIWRRWRS